MSRIWTKLRSDGTSYTYWQACDGCMIESKPRFRRMGYMLMVPSGVSGLDHNTYATYPTLREAQAAADAPTAAHAERELQQRQAWQRILHNTATHHAHARSQRA